MKKIKKKAKDTFSPADFSVASPLSAQLCPMKADVSTQFDPLRPFSMTFFPILYGCSSVACSRSCPFSALPRHSIAEWELPVACNSLHSVQHILQAITTARGMGRDKTPRPIPCLSEDEHAGRCYRMYIVGTSSSTTTIT